jgi:hypothetical protein
MVTYYFFSELIIVLLNTSPGSVMNITEAFVSIATLVISSIVVIVTKNRSKDIKEIKEENKIIKNDSSEIKQQVSALKKDLDKTRKELSSTILSNNFDQQVEKAVKNALVYLDSDKQCSIFIEILGKVTKEFSAELLVNRIRNYTINEFIHKFEIYREEVVRSYKLLDPPLANLLQERLKLHAISFLDEVRDILGDDSFNSKEDRYLYVHITFLNKCLVEVVKSYNQWKSFH